MTTASIIPTMSPSSDSPTLDVCYITCPVPSWDRPKGVTERIRGVGKGADVNYEALLIGDGDGDGDGSENVT